MPEINEKELIHNYNFYLSFGDLVQLDEVRSYKSEPVPRKVLEKILYENGLDVNQPYQVVYDTHRGLTKASFTTNRFVGFVRRDRKWREVNGENIDTVIDDLRNKMKYRGSDDILKR